MITVSEKMKAYLKQTGRSFHGKIEIGDSVIYDGIMSVFIDRSVCTNELTLGNVNCAFAEIVLYDCAISLEGQEIKVYLAAGIDGADEWIKIGTFTAEKPETDDKLTSFTAYDNVKYKTDGTYFLSESLTDEDTAAVDTVFADICQQCGVSFVPLFPDGTAEADKPKIEPIKLSGKTYKKALGLIAGFLGGNLICNADGQFEIRRFTDCDFTIDEGTYSEAKISETAFTVERIRCNTGETVLKSGAESGQEIVFENCLMTQSQLDSIFESLGGLSYHAISAENLVGNPCIEPGDIITLKKGDAEYKLPVMHVTVDFDGGIMNTFDAFSKTEEEKTGGLEDIKDVVGEAVDSVSKENSEFAEAINGALGLYVSKRTLSDGSTVYYYHNKESIDESTYIFTKNAEGFASVTGENCWNNGSPVWQYGVTNDGNAILNYLILNKLSAQHIDVNSLFAENITAKNEIKSEAMTEDLPKLFINMDKGTIELSYKKDGKIIRTFINEGAITLNDLSSTDGTTSLNLTALTAFGLYTGLISCSEFEGKAFKLSDGNTVAVAYGGTGATNATDARKNLDAAEDAKAVQQGGIAYKAPHKIHLDWDDSKLQLQVDNTSLGAVAMRGDLIRESHTLCTGKTIEAGQNLSLSIAVSKDGYIPIGIVGQHHGGSYATFAMIQNLYLDSVASGRGTVNCIVKNIHSSATIGKTGDLYSLSVDILWVKE